MTHREPGRRPPNSADEQTNASALPEATRPWLARRQVTQITQLVDRCTLLPAVIRPFD
jgi:hypothetical protein